MTENRIASSNLPQNSYFCSFFPEPSLPCKDAENPKNQQYDGIAMRHNLWLLGLRRAFRLSDRTPFAGKRCRDAAAHPVPETEMDQTGMGQRLERFPDFQYGLFLRAGRRGADALPGHHQSRILAHRPGHLGQHGTGAGGHRLGSPVLPPENTF